VLTVAARWAYRRYIGALFEHRLEPRPDRLRTFGLTPRASSIKNRAGDASPARLCLATPKSEPREDLLADILRLRDGFEHALLSRRRAIVVSAAARRQQKAVNVAGTGHAKAYDLAARIDTPRVTGRR
jgi:hypothetical protein